MKIKNFLLNVAKIAKAPSVANIPPLEVDVADLKEIIKWCEEGNISHTIVNEQEVQFRFDHLNFMAIQNDRGEEVGLGGIQVEKQKWVADLSEEDQKIVERNTVSEESTPTPAPDTIEEIRKDSIPQAKNSTEEQQKPLAEDLKAQQKETAAKAAEQKPPPSLVVDKTTSKDKEGK